MGNGRRAVARVVAWCADGAVVADVRMAPGVAEREACRWMRANRQGQWSRVVLDGGARSREWRWSDYPAADGRPLGWVAL